MPVSDSHTQTSQISFARFPVRMFKIHMLHGIFLFFVLFSMYGSIWVSDEYDHERMQVYGFFLTPVTIFWFYLCGFPRYARRWKLCLDSRSIFLMAVLILFHTWGALLAVNAFTGSSSPVTYTRLTQSRVEQRSMAVAYRRGGFGWLFRTRW